MKTALFTLILIITLANCDDDTNKSEQDLIQEIMKMQEQIEEEKSKTKSLQKTLQKEESETANKIQELEDVKKLGKTVDKVVKELGID